MLYPVKLTDLRGEFMVTSPDFPGLHTVGDTEEEALREAVDALETSIQAYIQDRLDIPAPSAPKRGQKLVAHRHGPWPSRACTMPCGHRDSTKPI